jgi:WD40 repeat protein
VVRVWDTSTATLLATLPGHDGGVLGVAIAPDAKSFATSASNGTILLWRMPPRPPSAVETGKAQLPTANKLPPGRKDTDGNLLPDAARARLGLQRFQSGIPVTGLRYSKDGNFILAQVTSAPASGGWVQYDLVLWNAQTGKLENKLHLAADYRGFRSGLPTGPHFWTVSNDGKFFASSLFGLSVYEIATG